MAVTFGGVPASAVKVLGATRLQAIAPAHATGAVDVVVTGATGTATLASGYTYLGQPPAGSASDLDGDGMSDLFEMRYSLDPSAGSDAALDPDADGSSNLQEFQAGSHPRGFFKRYLAEGATGAFFDLRLALANPDVFPAAVLLRFLKSDGTTASRDISVASLARATLDPEESVAGLAAAEFSSHRRIRHPGRGGPHDDLGRRLVRLACGDQYRQPVDDLVPRRGRHPLRLQPVLPVSEPERRRGERDRHVPVAGARGPDRPHVHAWPQIRVSTSGWISSPDSAPPMSRRRSLGCADHRRAGDVPGLRRPVLWRRARERRRDRDGDATGSWPREPRDRSSICSSCSPTRTAWRRR